MTKPVFPHVQMGKDVLLGILPFYHIYGQLSCRFPILLWDAEEADYRGRTVTSLYAYAWFIGRDHVTIRTRSLLSEHRKV